MRFFNVFLRSKRGEGEALNPLIVMVVVIFFLLISLMITINQVGERSSFENDFLAKDIALTINAMLAVDGIIVLDYPQDLFNKTVEIKGSQVYVWDYKRESTKRSARFIGSPLVRIDDNKFEPQKDGTLKLKFIGSGNRIIITDDPAFRLDTSTLQCPEFATKDEAWKSRNILFDISHRDDDNDLGNKKEGMDEASVIDTIAQYLDSQRASLQSLRFTREPGIKLEGKRTDKITSDTEVMISIHVGAYSDTLNELRAYYNPSSPLSREANKLSCLILNSIADKIDDVPITSLRIMPVQEDSPGYDMITAKDDMIALTLEIGNINSADGRKMLKKSSEIGKAIMEGMMRYYS